LNNIDPKDVEYGIIEVQRRNGIEKLKAVDKYSTTSDEDLAKEMDQIFKKAFEGWKGAPKGFVDRVRLILNTKTRLRTKRAPTEEPDLEDPTTFINSNIPKNAADSLVSLLKPLNESERKFFKERMNKYNVEFKFNTSSDYSLLMQLITEELIQQRLMIKKLKDPDANTDFEMTNSVKRLQLCMEGLGITRKQRQLAKSDVDGNIAQISALLDKKIKSIGLKEKSDKDEEELYESIKATRDGPRNIVPTIEAIKKIEKEHGIRDI